MLPADGRCGESFPVQVQFDLQRVRQHFSIGEQDVYGVKLARDVRSSIIHERSIHRTEVTDQTVRTEVTQQTGRRRSDGV